MTTPIDVDQIRYRTNEALRYLRDAFNAPTTSDRSMQGVVRILSQDVPGLIDEIQRLERAVNKAVDSMLAGSR